MYPQSELNRLATHKTALRRNIALQRVQCAQAAAGLAQPLEWLERLLVLGRRISSLSRLAAMPLSFLVTRAVFPRWKILHSLLRWSPLVFGAARGLRSITHRSHRDA